MCVWCLGFSGLLLKTYELWSKLLKGSYIADNGKENGSYYLGFRVKGLGIRVQGLGSKLLKEGYIGDYIWNYYRGC